MTAFYLLPGSDGSTRIWTGIVGILASCGDIGIPVRLAPDGEVGVQPGLRGQVERVEMALRDACAPAVLVGYSYSGLVAAAVARRARGAVATIVYLDAIVPEIASCAHELLARVPRTVRCLLGDDTPLLYAPVGHRRIPATYVRCTARPQKALYAAIDPSADCARALGWAYAEVPTGHRPMLEAPDELALELRAAAGRAAAGCQSNPRVASPRHRSSGEEHRPSGSVSRG